MKKLSAWGGGMLRGPRGGVAAISSGALVGQLILAGVTPLLSRLYTDEQFGALSFLLAVATVLGPVGSLRLESALLLPKDDDEARRLLRAGIAAAAVVSLATAGLMWGLERVGFDEAWGSVPFAPLWVAAMLFATATFALLSQAALRERAYGAVAKRSVSQAAGVAIAQTGLGLVSPSAAGLLGGFLIGRSFGYVPLYRSARAMFLRPRMSSCREVLRTYWRFPVAFMPSAVLNALGLQLPLIIIAGWFGAASAGELGITQRLVLVPSVLLGAAVAEVVGAELSRNLRQGTRGGNRAFYVRASVLLFGVALAVAFVLIMWGPNLLPFVLGESWELSGPFAQAMAVSVGFGLLASPLSRVYLVYQRAAATVAIDVARLLLIGTGAWIAYLIDADPIETAWLLYAGQACAYLLSWVYGLAIVSNADRESEAGRPPN